MTDVEECKESIAVLAPEDHLPVLYGPEPLHILDDLLAGPVVRIEVWHIHTLEFLERIAQHRKVMPVDV